jgi:hypothetical protein
VCFTLQRLLKSISQIEFIDSDSFNRKEFLKMNKLIIQISNLELKLIESKQVIEILDNKGPMAETTLELINVINKLLTILMVTP